MLVETTAHFPARRLRRLLGERRPCGCGGCANGLTAEDWERFDREIKEELRLITSILDTLDKLDAFPEYAQFSRGTATALIPRLYYDLYLIMNAVTDKRRKAAIKKMLKARTPEALKAKREVEGWWRERVDG
jgi:hypothetical protein